MRIKFKKKKNKWVRSIFFYLVHNQDLVVDGDGDSVGLDNQLVLWVVLDHA